MRRKAALLALCMALAAMLATPASAVAVGTWTPQTSGVNQRLYDVSMVSATEGWAVGSSGTILHYSGGTWGSQTSPVPQDLYCVDMVSETEGWATGSSGTILHTADGGNTWETQSSGTEFPLFDIDFVGPAEGWAVGGGNGVLILHTSDGGVTWSSRTIGSAGFLFGVHFASVTEGWAVGTEATILYTANGGSSWSAQTSSAGLRDLYSVDCVSPTQGWIVGTGGTILHKASADTYWPGQASGTDADMYSVRFPSPTEGWAAGGGQIMHTSDGGAVWTLAATEPVLALDFVSANEGWAVGNTGTILHYSDGGTPPPTGTGSVSVSVQAPPPAPVLTFGITAGTQPSGGSITDSALDFGLLSHGTAKTASHRLTVTTNAQGGYGVTASESTPLTSGGNTIPDVTGDGASITEIVPGAWGNASTYGFGYGLANTTGTDAAFTSGFKQFANLAGTETAQQVMTNEGAVTGSAVDVTYKVNIGPSQAAGTYTNTITYIATGGF